MRAEDFVFLFLIVVWCVVGFLFLRRWLIPRIDSWADRVVDEASSDPWANYLDALERRRKGKEYTGKHAGGVGWKSDEDSMTEAMQNDPRYRGTFSEPHFPRHRKELRG